MNSTTPILHMHSNASEDFYRCLNALISYVFEQLDIVFPHHPLITAHNIDELDCASYVLDNIWDNPSIIRNFVRDNPCRLTPQQLGYVSLWRFALRDIFICFESSNDTILACNTERIFVVSSLLQPITHLIGPMPAMASLVLLPFQNRIVCDGRIKYVGRSTTKDLPLVVEHFMHPAADLPFISAPEDLISYRQTLPKNHDITAEFELSLMQNALGF